MKTLNITFSDEVHSILLKLKNIYGLSNLNEAVAEAIKREYKKEVEKT